jgi:hypothetical protein
MCLISIFVVSDSKCSNYFPPYTYPIAFIDYFSIDQLSVSSDCFVAVSCKKCSTMNKLRAVSHIEPITNYLTSLR